VTKRARQYSWPPSRKLVPFGAPAGNTFRKSNGHAGIPAREQALPTGGFLLPHPNVIAARAFILAKQHILANLHFAGAREDPRLPTKSAT